MNLNSTSSTCHCSSLFPDEIVENKTVIVSYLSLFYFFIAYFVLQIMGTVKQQTHSL
jgi:hypothetical protein